MDPETLRQHPFPAHLRSFLTGRRDHWRRRGGQVLVLPPTGPSRSGFSCDEGAGMVVAERQTFGVEWPGGCLEAGEDDVIITPVERAFRHRWDGRRRFHPGLVLSASREDVVVQQRNAEPRRWKDLTWRFAAGTGPTLARVLELLVHLAEGPAGGEGWNAASQRRLVVTAFDLVLAASEQPLRASRGGRPVAVRCRDHLRQHLGEADLKVGAVAAALGYDQRTLGRRYRQETGQTLRETLIHLRVQRARELLRQRGLPIAAIAARCGFNDPTHFARTFRRLEGYSPRDFRRHGHLEGEES